MSIKINITEQNNRLDFSENYSPIVCGNSNYVLNFTFSERWAKCDKKAAIFIVEGNKLTVDFEGSECKVPVLPNAAFALVSVVSGEGENQLATTALKIRLESSIIGGDFSEYNQLTNYLPKILSALNAIKNGEVTAKQAVNALLCESAKEADSAKVANIANIANNVSNPNLLINGDFRVNQRGQREYSSSGYTVDRWRQTEATMIVNEDKSIVVTNFKNYGRLVQQLEDIVGLKGKDVTLSVKFKNVSYTTESDPRIIINDGVNNTISSTIPNGFSGVVSLTKTISDNATSLSVRAIHNHLVSTNSDLSVTIEWVKLEIGTTPTEFSPRSYAEELALCQRFYWKNNQDGNTYNPIGICFCTNNSRVDLNIALPQQLRTKPTIIWSNLYFYKTNAISITNVTVSRINANYITINCTSSGLTSGEIGLLRQGNEVKYVELDAEIY